MAKEDIDDKLKDGEIPGGNDRDDNSERQEQEAPKDVRGALRAAIKEQAEKESEVDSGSDEQDLAEDRKGKKQAKSDTSKSRNNETFRKEDKASRKAVSSKSEEDTSGDDIQSTVEPENKGDGTGSDNKESEEKLEAPAGFWKSKGKVTWDKLDKEAQQTLLAREQEISQGFQQVSQRLRSFDEMEKVLAPRSQMIQQFGVSQAQVVDRLFQWMEALGNPNPAIKTHAIKSLAQNFGIDINQLSPNQSEESEETENNISNQPPAWVSEFTQSIQGELNGIKKSMSDQKQAAADALVSNWARDKKYYGQVSQLMAQLLSSQAVPLKEDGTLDLDGAYEAAIKIHPQVSAQIQQEATEKAKADQKAKADKEAKDRAAKLAAAKKAGTGIKPGASSISPVLTAKPNGKGPVSVKDSIRAAFEELRDN